MARGWVNLIVCGVVVAGFVLPHAVAATPPTLPVSLEHVAGARTVQFFFSDLAWGGVPFTEVEKQRVMVEAMLKGKPARIEAEVTHLLSAPNARVRRFAAVFEVDGSVAPPVIHSGYELELLVPHSRKALSVELENAETGIVNRVEVEPDGSL